MRGFTLPEVIIASVVAVLVGGLLLGILVQGSGVFYNQSQKVSQGLSINDTLSKIRGFLKEAQSVASGYPVISPDYTSSSSTVVLKIPSIDSSDNVLINTFDFVVFSKDSDKLIFKLFPDSLSSRKSQDQILSLNVDSVNFAYFDSLGIAVSPTSAVKVKITLRLKQKTGREEETNVATSEANLRND